MGIVGTDDSELTHPPKSIRGHTLAVFDPVSWIPPRELPHGILDRIDCHINPIISLGMDRHLISFLMGLKHEIVDLIWRHLEDPPWVLPRVLRVQSDIRFIKGTREDLNGTIGACLYWSEPH